jgi:hypothetical protein
MPTKRISKFFVGMSNGSVIEFGDFLKYVSSPTRGGGGVLRMRKKISHSFIPILCLLFFFLIFFFSLILKRSYYCRVLLFSLSYS